MGAYATGAPLYPRGYTGGTITFTGAVPVSLLALIQAQVDANAMGVGREVTIQTDTSGALYFGPQSNLVGALSATNYAYSLPSGGASRTYRSSFPGNEAPVGDLYVFMNAGGTMTFHVEIA